MYIITMVFLSIVATGAILAIWAMAAYNRLVSLSALVEEAWSGIDVQLKRRYDLIPNLVAVVNQYRIHEKEVLEKVTQTRAASMNAQTIGEKGMAEKDLTGALKTLFAVAENYPDLKANENFLALQQQLSTLETEIQLSRRYYNGTARNYNINVATFPSNIMARIFQFKKVAYFELPNEKERDVPKVDFK